MQTAPTGGVAFSAHGFGIRILLAQDGSVFLGSHTGVVGLKFIGANRERRIEPLMPLPGRSNCLFGNDPSKWRTNITSYSRVYYRNLYAGVDLVYHGNQRQLEYDLIVAAGANPKAILMQFEAPSPHISPEGDLIVSGDLRLRKPRAYQRSNGARKNIPVGYILEGRNRVAFALGRYDHTLPLIIDPVLTYATFLGGSSDDTAYAVATDPSGNTYIAGYTASVDLPTTTGALNRSFIGGTLDAFVAKFSPSGTLLYTTYLGGTGDEEAYALAVDSQGNAYVTGYTTSPDFPTTTGAYRSTLSGTSDAFVAKLNPAGTALVYSSYLGGSGDDTGWGIAVDGMGDMFITGSTSSADFPVSSGSYHSRYSGGDLDGFVTAIYPYGGFLYSTYLGGSGDDVPYAIAVDSSGNAYVAGETQSVDFPNNPGVIQASKLGTTNAFVASLNPSGTALNFSTFLGGTSDDHAYGVAVDSTGDAYVTGYTSSADFPHTSGVLQSASGGGYDGFVAKINPSGTALVYSTFLGGSGDDYALAVALDGIGNAYITGNTSSGNFPITSDATQSSLSSTYGAFVAVLNRAGAALSYGTFLGGSGFETGYGIALSPDREFTAVGYTVSPDFPVAAGAFQKNLAGGADAFLARFSALPLPALNIAKSHTGNFMQGQDGATYQITVSNSAGAGTTSGTVTVTETVPSGLTLESMAGTGWSCPSGGNICTRSDSLNGGASYLPITVTVDVAAGAQPSLINQVSVSGGGSAMASTSDPTTITAFTYSPCDVNQDQSTNVADVQRVINEALGVAPAVNDLNHDGAVNVPDVQIVINAALGLGCSAS
jgi:uncharacterized repeat protein (TIGR01451 family)